MARRRNSQGGGILIALGLIVAAVAFLGPFAIAGWSIFSEIRARRFGGASRAADLISSSERARVTAFEAELAGLERLHADVYAEGDAEGLLRRVDTKRFDARNLKGRNLNQALEQVEAQYAEIAASRDGLKEDLEARINAWLAVRAGLVAARVALVIFIAVFVFSFVSQAPQAEGFSVSRLMFGIDGDNAARIAASLGATITAGIFGWIGGAITRKSLAA